MDTDQLYWLFSTIAQTLGAIVGVIGMLTIYKLQIISNYIDKKMENSLLLRMKVFPGAGDQPPEDFYKGMKEINLKAFNLKDNEMMSLRQDWHVLASQLFRERRLIKGFLFFIIPNLLFIFISIIAIIWIPSITSWNEIFISTVIGAFSLYAFLSCLYLVLVLLVWKSTGMNLISAIEASLRYE